MMNDSNVNNSGVIINFLEAIRNGNENDLRSLCHPAIQYFDPLFGGVEGENVILLKLYEASFPRYSLSTGTVEDLGEGYYKCPWEKSYTYPVTGRDVRFKGVANIRVENGLVTGYSDAFSLHRWAKDAYGFMGYMFGSIFFFQRKMRREAAEKFREYVSSLNFSQTD